MTGHEKKVRKNRETPLLLCVTEIIPAKRNGEAASGNSALPLCAWVSVLLEGITR